jgi:uncharacterized Zn finger protein (UPF0148 family)
MATTNKRGDRCPRCNAVLLNDAGEPYCLAHGTINPRDVVHITEEDMFAKKYDPRKDEILKCLETLSCTEAEKQLELPKNTIWAVLASWRTRGLIPKDYNPPVKGHRKLEKQRVLKEPSGRKPQIGLPPWNEAWGDVVKVAWLTAFSGK